MAQREIVYPGLEAIAIPVCRRLMRELCEIGEEEIIESPYINHGLEKTFPDIADYLDDLVTIVDEEGDRDLDVERAVRWSYHFAHNVGSVLLDKPSSMNTSRLPVGKQTGYLDAREELADVTAEYLAKCPTLDDIIEVAVPQLDLSNRHSRVVRNVAGSTFLGIDTAEEKYVELKRLLA